MIFKIKKVLVPMLSANPGQFGSIHGVRDSYIKKLAKNNLVPVFVSYEMSLAQINEIYKSCGGALFTGGGDFDPSLYEKIRHQKVYGVDPKRDRLELSLLKKILRDQKPFLGICRGAQALALASGGTLFQHISETSPQEKHEVKNYAELQKKSHDIFIDQKSKIYKMIGKEKIRVNSGHHQAIKEPGKNITITARSSSGITEIIEHKKPGYFCFGIQSHPEALVNSDLEVVFKAFAQAILKNK